MYSEKYSGVIMKEVITNKFPNCIFENSTLKIINNLKDEYLSLRYGVALRFYEPVVIQMQGKDSLDFLHRISTNDIKNLQRYQKKNTLFLNEKGRFIDRTTLINVGDYLMLIGLNDGTPKLYNWINKYIITEEIETNDLSYKNIIIEIIGPQSESFLTLLLDERLNELGDNNFIDVSIENINFKIYSHKEKSDVIIYRILIDVAYLNYFIDYVLNNKSFFDLRFIGEETYQIFRVEMGIPDITEINLNFNPHEIDLTHEVSFTKGCYIGQEVIARLETYDKVQRKLTGIIFADENCDIKLPAEILSDNEEEIGIITKVVQSELLNKTIGIALIRKRYLGNYNFSAFIDNKKVNFAITNLPFTR